MRGGWERIDKGKSTNSSRCLCVEREIPPYVVLLADQARVVDRLAACPANPGLVLREKGEQPCPFLRTEPAQVAADVAVDDVRIAPLQRDDGDGPEGSVGVVGRHEVHDMLSSEVEVGCLGRAQAVHELAETLEVGERREESEPTSSSDLVFPQGEAVLVEVR